MPTASIRRLVWLAPLAWLLSTPAPVPAQTMDRTSAIAPAEAIVADRLEELGGFSTIGRRFLEQPELRNEPGSGWKPWMRSQWFAQTRRAPAGRSAAQLRRDAWQAHRARSTPARGDAGWFTIGPATLSGRCTDLSFHPSDASVVYMGTAGGGLWKSTDGGDTWAPLTDDLPSIAVGAVEVLPSDPNVVLLGTGEANGVPNAGNGADVFGVGMYRSTDAGATWNTTSLSYGQNQTHGFGEIAVEPTTGVILAGATDGLWRSTDDGASWTMVQSGGNIYDVEWKPGDANTVYIARGRDPFQNFGVANGVKVSTDAGLTFAPAGPGQPAAASIGNTEISVTAADPSTVYAIYVQSGTGSTLGVYRSTDSGATWSPRNTTVNMTNAQGWYDLALAADPTDADRILTGGVGLRISTDAGATYTGVPTSNGSATTPHVDFHAMVWEPGSTTDLWVANDGGPWRSTDGGATWASRREGLVTYQYYDICVAQTNPHGTWGGMQDSGISGRLDSSTVWVDPPVVGDGGVCHINPNNASRIYGERQGGDHRKSNDGGGFWFTINNGLTGTGPFIAASDQDQSAAGHLYTTMLNGIYRTTNGGNLWTNVASHTARWISISPVDGDVIWTVSNSLGVWLTTNDGGSWTKSVTFPNNGLETKIHAHPEEIGTAIVTYGGYGTGLPHVLVTTDSGATWTNATGDFPDQPANTFLVDPDRVDEWYLGSDVGVWFSSDRGATWTAFGTDLPNVVITDLELRRDARKLVAGTYGRGVWEIDLAPSATAVPLATPPGSRHLMLDSPGPNPTSDPVHLRFAARSTGEVRLAVFDVAGRLVTPVATLPRGDGLIRNAVWSPAGKPSGVYFAMLQAGGERVSRKIVVTR